MLVSIFQIDNKKDLLRRNKETLEPISNKLTYGMRWHNAKGVFNIRDYICTQITIRATSDKYYRILKDIEDNFNSFYTSNNRTKYIPEGKAENSIIVSDIVRIDEEYFYFDEDSKWKCITPYVNKKRKCF